MTEGYARQEAQGKLRCLLGIPADNADSGMRAEFALESAEELARNYCNIDDIPAGLTNTVIKMAVDIFRNESYGSAQVPQAIKSVSMGDTKTDFGTAQAAGYNESLLRDYRKQLNRYRRVRH